jgi:hypothetical protein
MLNQVILFDVDMTIDIEAKVVAEPDEMMEDDIEVTKSPGAMEEDDSLTKELVHHINVATIRRTSPTLKIPPKVCTSRGCRCYV